MHQHRSILTKFSGPPGTGKSTTLLNIMDRLLSTGTCPEDIVFTTFTRAGANEAQTRACEKFNLSPNRLPWFRTLHSICLSLIDRQPAMSWSDWASLGETIGVQFSVKFTPEDPIPRGQTRGDHLLALWSYARVTRRDPREVYQTRHETFLGHEDVTMAELDHFIASVHNFKQAHGKIDFTDMLERYLAHGPLLNADAVIIDEAQDLSLLQWEVVDKLCRGAKKVFVAGDDDQCIHAWNGASPEAFIALDAQTYTVLPQSYRIPATVHTLAQTIIQRVQRRLPKSYEPRQDPGKIIHLDDLATLPLHEGTWLMLGRNHQFLMDYVAVCQQQGFLFQGERLPGLSSEAIQALRSWLQLIEGKTITHAQASGLYRFMPQGVAVTRGCKQKLYATTQLKDINFDLLHQAFGLVALRDTPWEHALGLMDGETKACLAALRRNGELENECRIRIGTIHSAKGREADHVVIRPEMSYRTWQAFEQNPDAEHRCWYVGVTRARQTLYVLNSANPRTYPL
jgi:DNA helicase-2/ATP-dependent DNA helicase PcrA